MSVNVFLYNIIVPAQREKKVWNMRWKYKMNCLTSL